MADTKLFIVSILLILLISFALHKQTQITFSLKKLDSILESFKSIYEKSGPLNDEDITELKKINLELDELIASGHNNQLIITTVLEVCLVSIKTLATIVGRLQKSATPFIKLIITTVLEVSLLSINTLATIVEKLQKLATPFIKGLYISVIPYVMKMSMWLLSELVKGINVFFQFCLEAAR